MKNFLNIVWVEPFFSPPTRQKFLSIEDGVNYLRDRTIILPNQEERAEVFYVDFNFYQRAAISLLMKNSIDAIVNTKDSRVSEAPVEESEVDKIYRVMAFLMEQDDKDPKIGLRRRKSHVVCYRERGKISTAV